MSGGQHQRVALGRAIVRDPAVFLMDEPLSNLDVKLRIRTRAELIRLHDRPRTTTIYVTHDQQEAMTLGDRIAVFNAGTIQQLGTPDSLYNHPINLFVASFIGSPSMNLIEGIIEAKDGNLVVTGRDFALRVPPEPAHMIDQHVGTEVMLGIHPEHLFDRGRRRIADDPDAGGGRSSVGAAPGRRPHRTWASPVGRGSTGRS